MDESLVRTGLYLICKSDRAKRGSSSFDVDDFWQAALERKDFLQAELEKTYGGKENGVGK